MSYPRTKIKKGTHVEIDGKVYTSLPNAVEATGISYKTIADAIRDKKMYVTQVIKKQVRIRKVTPEEAE